MKGENGFSLIEVVVSLALLGIIVVAFFSGLALASKVVISTDFVETGKDLAEAQMEYVQDQTYDRVNNPPIYQTLPNLATSYPGYSIATPMAVRLDKGSGTATDTGIQQITIVVLQGTTPVFTLVGEKVKW